MTEPVERQESDRLKREALDWLARVGLGAATESDLAALRRWRDSSTAHAAALAQAGRLWRGLRPAVEALARDAGSTARCETPVSGDRWSRRWVLGGAVASGTAAVGFLLLQPPLHLWPSLAELDSDYRTVTGERRHLTISDGVALEMNTRTSISMHTANDGVGIELISGEAAVTVAEAPPQPFVVFAAGGSVTAHRATFNLRRDGAAVRLTCIDGEVALTCGRRALRLRPSEQVTYDAQGVGVIVATDPTIVAAWRDGVLVFHDVPLAQVIDEVNRYRRGRIFLVDTALGRRLVTARFEIDRLDTVIGQIRRVFNAPVRTLPGGVALVG